VSESVNARIPMRVREKLAQYCTKQGLTQTETIIRALDQYLDHVSGGPDAYSLVADLIPPKGLRTIQAERVRGLARKAFRGARSR
jgi:hypothetical protein